MQYLQPIFSGNHTVKVPGIYRIGGKTFTTSQLAKLTGAPEGTTFKFSSNSSAITITGTHPVFFDEDKPLERMIIDTNDGLSLFNVQFQIKSEFRRNGNGFKMLHSQLNACRQLEIPFIRCIAGRWMKGDGGKRQELDGYMVWPKLGFDGTIPDGTKALLGQDFAAYRTIQELVQQPGGWAEWQRHGDGARLTFEVDSGSVHSSIFMAYGKTKGYLP